MSSERRPGREPDFAGEAARVARDTAREVAMYKAAVDEFTQKFVEKTSNIKNFINIFELEEMIKDLMAKTHQINMDLASHLVDSLDESKMARKKKDDFKRLGIRLRTHKKTEAVLRTIAGPLRLRRYILRPADALSSSRLMELTGQSAVIPLDELLKFGDWPFRATPAVMLEAAYWAAAPEAGNFAPPQAARGAVAKSMANFVGMAALESDLARIPKQASGAKSAGPIYAALEKFPVKARIIAEKGADGGVKTRTYEARFAYLATVFKGSPAGFRRAGTQGAGFPSPKSRLAESPPLILETMASFEPGLLGALLRRSAARHGEGRLIAISDGGAWVRAVASDLGAELVLGLGALSAQMERYASHRLGSDEEAKRWAGDRIEECLAGKAAEALEAAAALGGSRGELAELESFLSANSDIIGNGESLGPAERLKTVISDHGANDAIKSAINSRFSQLRAGWKMESAQCRLALMGKMLSNLWREDVVKPVMRRFGQEI